MAAKRDDKRAVELACKIAGANPKDLLGWAIREETGEVVIVVPSGQKYVYKFEQLEAARQDEEPPTRAKVEGQPATTTQLKTPAPERAESRKQEADS